MALQAVQSPTVPTASLPEGLRLPDVCYWPLIHPTPPDNPAHQLTLYLDGAANGTHAAWSVIATLNLPIGEVYIGCMYGCVHLEPDNPQWIGADAMDNIAAELSAMAMAQTCALRWPYSDHLNLHPPRSVLEPHSCHSLSLHADPMPVLLKYAASKAYGSQPGLRSWKSEATRAMPGMNLQTQWQSGP